MGIKQKHFVCTTKPVRSEGRQKKTNSFQKIGCSFIFKLV